VSYALDPALFFEHAPVGVALLDRQGIVLHTNAPLRAMLGRSSAELLGLPLALHLHEEEGARHHEILAELERRAIPHMELERRYRCGAGEVIVVRELVSAVPGAGVAAFLEDVTELRREEREQRAQMCLAHLGEMASVVAHEVRNALAGVGSAVEVIGQGFAADTEERLAVEEVRRRVTDLSDMARGFVRIARARPLRRSPVSVRVLLSEVARALAESEGRTRLDVSGADADVGADVELLAMALLHLITVRARVGAPSRVSVQACPKRVALRIAGDAADAHEERRSMHVDLDASLALCIIEAHGGELSVDRGAAATITLPRAGSPE
jgi:PAS domain S-box-containing protein